MRRWGIISIIGGLLVMLPSPARAQAPPDPRGETACRWVVAGSQLADVVSTEIALRSNPHAYEANPLLREPAARWAIRAGMIVVQDRAIRYLWRKNRKAAVAAAVGMALANGWIAGQNLRHVRR